MILLIGATGTTGREVLSRLTASGVKTRALVRDPKKIASVKKTGAEIAFGSLDKPETLTAALKDIQKVFLLSSAAPNQVELHRNFFSAAKAAGVRHIVRMSALGADPASTISLGEWHGKSEKDLEASGIVYTHLRPHFFMQNFFSFASTIAVKGEFYAPLKDGKISMVDTRDIAETAVAALTGLGHEGKTYTLTGPEALSFETAAQKLSQACGKSIRYVNVAPEDAKKGMLSAGLPEWLVDALIELYGVFSSGKASFVSGDIDKVLGKPARNFDAFAKDFAAALKGQ